MKDQKTEAARQCLDFIDDLCHRVRNLPEPTRSSTVIDMVLDSGRLLFLTGEERCYAAYADPYFGISKADPELRRKLRQGFHALQQHILWHLAAMGHPVEMEALVCCPDIRAAASCMLELHKEAGEAKKVREVVERSVTTLISRCLVFRISKRPRGKDDEEEERYIIHRQLQRHVYRTMGAPLVEPQTVDHFSITLYADQPDEAPVLTVEAHKKLQRVVAALSGYPGEGGSSSAASVPRVWSLNLKAALGILRNCYSVGGVARLDQYASSRGETNGEEALMPGCFEEHRLYLRWLIEQAKSGKPEAVAPFYTEELVWLYNECGVISYIEGHVQDAAALLFMADQAASKLQPGDDGALRLAIRLNQALVDIDTGNLSSAKTKLKLIIESEKDQPNHLRDTVLLLLARGYEALVGSINGNYDQSKNTLREVKGELAQDGRSRAAAIFSQHLGDLLCTHGELQEARTTLEQALQFAVAGGHEDIRHQIILSLIRVRLTDAGSPNISQVMAEIAVVETYGRNMGIPRLLAEVDELRARFHLRGGDLSAASTYASQSLSLAALQDFKLRKASSLGLLAEIHLEMGFTEDCRAELDELRSLAQQIDYQAASVQAQKLSSRLSWRQGVAVAPPT